MSQALLQEVRQFPQRRRLTAEMSERPPTKQHARTIAHQRFGQQREPAGDRGPVLTVERWLHLPLHQRHGSRVFSGGQPLDDGDIGQSFRLVPRRGAAMQRGDGLGRFRRGELEAERIAQAALAALSAGAASAGSPALARANLEAYVAHRNVKPDEADHAALEAILSAAAFPT